MFEIYKEEIVNKIVLIFCWFGAILAAVLASMIKYDIRDGLTVIYFSIIFIIPTIIYFFNRRSRVIRYFTVWGTIVYIYIIMYFQNGLFDSTYFIFLAFVGTSLYFDEKLTVLSAVFTILSSSLLYATHHKLFFPIFRIDNFISMELTLFLIAGVLTFQTYWSKKLVVMQKELYKKAIKDMLTNVYNRTYFEDNFLNIINRYKELQGNLSIIVFDIDFFKKVNDTYGHDKGDVVLSQLASHVVEVCRKSDIIIRIGGEEFLIILEDTNANEAKFVAEKVRKHIQDSNIEGLKITISLGVTILNKEDTDKTFFKRADEALYEAKHSGRNCSILKQ